MPKDKGQEHIIDAPYPITADEVRDMVAAVDKRRRLKSLTDSDYRDLALWLSNQTRAGLKSILRKVGGDPDSEPSEAEYRFRIRWLEAASLLKRTHQSPGSFEFSWNVNKASKILQEAIDQASSLLGVTIHGRPPSMQLKQWAPWCMAIAYTMSDIVRSCGGPGGTGRKSIAAQFASLAAARVGWRDEHGRPITPAAIARYCEHRPMASNDHKLS